MIPLFCFPEGIHLARELKGFINFNFVLTTEVGDRFYCNCLTFKEGLSQGRKEELGLPVADQVYYEKALCILSKHRYTDEFEECLRHLYRLSMSKNDVPFHKVVASFVENLRLPKEKELGLNGMSYSYGGSNINFETNPPYPIISVLRLLSRKEPSTASSSSPPIYHQRILSHPAGKKGHLRLSVQDRSRIRGRGFSCLYFPLSLGARPHPHPAFDPQGVHHSPSPPDRGDISADARQQVSRVRCKAL